MIHMNLPTPTGLVSAGRNRVYMHARTHVVYMHARTHVVYMHARTHVVYMHARTHAHEYYYRVE